jgi:hypothetical protein
VCYRVRCEKDRSLYVWVFVADITDDFILRLDVLQAYDASVDVGRHLLRLDRDEVPVREAPTSSVLKQLRPTESRWNSRPVCWQCEGSGHLGRVCPRRTAKEAFDKRDWRRDCATGGRGNARRQMAMSTPTSPCVVHQPDEKRRLEGCNAALEKQFIRVEGKGERTGGCTEKKREDHCVADRGQCSNPDRVVM